LQSKAVEHSSAPANAYRERELKERIVVSWTFLRSKPRTNKNVAVLTEIIPVQNRSQPLHPGFRRDNRDCRLLSFMRERRAFSSKTRKNLIEGGADSGPAPILVSHGRAQQSQKPDEAAIGQAKHSATQASSASKLPEALCLTEFNEEG
jgi:hypothetical protein